jgi:hypothetical protein
LEVSGQLHVAAVLPPGKGPPVPIGEEAGWAPESVWTLWRREKNLSMPGIEPEPVAIPTGLCDITEIIGKIKVLQLLFK